MTSKTGGRRDDDQNASKKVNHMTDQALRPQRFNVITKVSKNVLEHSTNSRVRYTYKSKKATE